MHKGKNQPSAQKKHLKGSIWYVYVNLCRGTTDAWKQVRWAVRWALRSELGAYALMHLQHGGKGLHQDNSHRKKEWEAQQKALLLCACLEKPGEVWNYGNWIIHLSSRRWTCFWYISAKKLCSSFLHFTLSIWRKHTFYAFAMNTCTE